MWRCQKKQLPFGISSMLRDFKIVRLLVVSLSMAAWFVASNHCVLAARPSVGKVAGCAMHQKTSAPQPEKGNGCGDLPCCKSLQATANGLVKTVAKPTWLGALQPFCVTPGSAIDAGTRQLSPIRDNGPPGENSFAELVLQRSILAHAPPVSLS